MPHEGKRKMRVRDARALSNAKAHAARTRGSAGGSVAYAYAAARHKEPRANAPCFAAQQPYKMQRIYAQRGIKEE